MLVRDSFGTVVEACYTEGVDQDKLQVACTRSQVAAWGAPLVGPMLSGGGEGGTLVKSSLQSWLGS